MKGYIYKITNPKGAVYIGKTTNPKDRFKFYRLGHCQRQVKIYRSLKKYGWDNHIVEIIHTIPYDENELNRLEAFYVDQFKSFTKTGLNLTPGGKFGYISELNKQMTRERMKKVPVSEVTKQKLREANLGKKQSPETIAKRQVKIKGMKRSDQSRINISNARKGMKFSDSHRESLRNVKREPYSAERREKCRIVFARARAAGKMRKRVRGKKIINPADGKEFISLKLACAYYGLVYCTVKHQLNGRKGYGPTFLKVAS